MATKWPFSPFLWLILSLWALLAMGVEVVLREAYRLWDRIRGP